MKLRALSLIAAAACSCGPSTLDLLQPDGGAVADAGAIVDAGAHVPDAGAPADSGTSVPDAGPALFNAAQYVSQTVPASVTAAATFEVKVTMKNTGTTPWAQTATRGHYLGSEGPRDNSTWGTNRIFIPPGVTVPPGATFTFTRPVTAPAAAGSYPMQWQLLQDGVEWFGPATPAASISVVKAGPPPGSTALQIITFNRNQFGTPMTPSELIACLRGAAKDLNAEGIPGGPFGVLVKPSGNNCDGYSCDIICSGQGQQQRQWDVLIGSEAEAKPVWAEVSNLAVRPCEIL